MSTLLLGLLLAIVSNALAQPTLIIGANTRVVATGAVQLVYGGGALTNNGSLSLAAGQLSATGPTTYGGSGAATVANVSFGHPTGSSTLNSLLSVTNRATLSANTALNANGQLYLRTDQFPNADLVNDGLLTGTVQGLLTRATVTTGATPYNSRLSTNVSGSVMRYQWQSSPNNGTFTDVAGATQPTYTANVTASAYYRCRLTTSNSNYDQTTPALLLTYTPVNTAPVATSNANQTATVGTAFTYTVTAFTDAETPASLTYSARIDPANGLSFDPATRVISGVPSLTGVSSVTVTATDPGSLSASTTFSITVSPAPVVSGPFAITGVTTVDCTPVLPGRYSISFTPQYSGLNSQPVSFSIANELLPTTNPGPYTLQLYTDNPVLTLRATQAGTPPVQTSFSYNWLAACQASVSTNTPPRVLMSVPPQSATVGVGFSYVIPAGTFTDDQTPGSLVLSASGLPSGLSLSGYTISGTPSTTVGSPFPVSITATDPGSLSVSTSFVLTVAPGPATPPISSGVFSITGVSMLRCTPVADRINISFAPRYAGLNGQAIAFRVVNELAPTNDPAPYSLTLYRDNPVIRLRATQTGSVGEASFDYNWLTACASMGSDNTAPRVLAPVANQTATVGMGYSLNLSNTFADQETPNGLVLTASGLPAGLTLTGTAISGTPSVSGVSSVTVTATDPGNLSVSTTFTITVSPANTPTPPNPTAPFAITGVTTASCVVLTGSQRSVTFTPQYAGRDGSPVSFSVVNELATTTAPGPYTLSLYTDNPTITLRAVQNGVSSSFAYNWLAACGSGSRQGASPEAALDVIVYGNPLTTPGVEVEVRGVQGQTLRLEVVNQRGYPVSTANREAAAAVERIPMRVGSDAGLYFLRVSTPTQQKTIKLLKQ